MDALTWAIVQHQDEFVTLYINNGYDINHKNIHGWVPTQTFCTNM
jgi:hypothetical protein